MAEKYVPIFYDWIEATQELNAQEKGRLIDAIVLYARGGDWQEQIKGNERYVFPSFRLQVKRAKKISEVRSTARNSDKPEQKEQTTSNGDKTEQKEQTPSKPLTNTNTNTNTNTKKNTMECDKRASRFTPPAVENVEAYAKEMGYTGFSAERFVDFYASKGWKVGKSPMQDWKAAVRGWVSRDRHGNTTPDTNPALDYPQREYKAEDYGKSFFVDYDELFGAEAAT